MTLPDPNATYPNPNLKEIVFVKNVIKRSNIVVGDYTYYDDATNPEDFEKHVTHHNEFLDDTLRIGKFCSIASGIEFIMNGANHMIKSATDYPFDMLGSDWSKNIPKTDQLMMKHDTIVGNDVRFGRNVTVMPGVHIHSGAVITANSTVTTNVAPYSIVGGNPAKFIDYRFTAEEILLLEELAWWDRDTEWIDEHIGQLTTEKITVNSIKELLKQFDSCNE